MSESVHRVKDNQLIDAVKDGDLQALEMLLRSGANPNQQDALGWTPLNWAAGKGDATMVGLLLAHDADVTLTGRDNRTPLMIARAARRNEVCALLADAERARGVWQDPRETVIYCKGYPIGDLRTFADWYEKPAADPLADDDIVYVHQDLTVTRSMWHGEDVLLNEVTPAWRAFCETTLRFEIPEDVL